ncbi:hypothetical protein UXU46_00340 (plasmid) [Campylobacter jejuni]
MIALIRNNWDAITGYIEKEAYLMIGIHFDTALEDTTLACK